MTVAPDPGEGTLRSLLSEADFLMVRTLLSADLFETPDRLQGVIRHGTGWTRFRLNRRPRTASRSRTFPARMRRRWASAPWMWTAHGRASIRGNWRVTAWRLQATCTSRLVKRCRLTEIWKTSRRCSKQKWRTAEGAQPFALPLIAPANIPQIRATTCRPYPRPSERGPCLSVRLPRSS